MGKGKDYELALKNEIMSETADVVAAFRPDFSGNSRFSVADVIVVWPHHITNEIEGAFVEIKKRSADGGKRKTVMSGSKKDQSGLEELEELVEGTPPWATAWLMVKFDHREAIIVDAAELLWSLRTDDPDEDRFHGARLTPSENISMIKPELSYWESSTAGMADWRKLLAVIGVEGGQASSEPFEIEVDAVEDAAA